MPRPDFRPFCFLLAAALWFTLLCLPSLAYYESDENSDVVPPAYAGNVISITSEKMGEMPPDPEHGEEPEPVPTPDRALTPEGNLTLVDDIIQGNADQGKQFLTVQSKKGNTFYLVIDRAGDKENVHFLNLVDESDLLALTEDGEATVTPAVCTCKEKCFAGHVDTACPICAVNMAECTGKAPEPTPTPAPAEPEPEPEAPAKKSPTGAILVLLILAIGGAAAFYFVKVKGMSLPFQLPFMKQNAGGALKPSEHEDEDDDAFLEFEKADEPGPEVEADGLQEPYHPIHDDGDSWMDDEDDEEEFDQ